MIRENKYPVQDLIVPQNVLASVSDKTGLEKIIMSILMVNPQVRFFSTGGTGTEIISIIKKIAANLEVNYMSVEKFTGTPEMEGGLVKTLNPKIFAGVLGERNNPAHEQYLRNLANTGRGPGVYFDILIGNFYPFDSVIFRDDITAEAARVNIDIGGPSLAEAAAKNWPSVAVVSTTQQYDEFTSRLIDRRGTNLQQRFYLAQYALDQVGKYRKSIGGYFMSLLFDRDVKPFLKISGGK
ncbi:MAG: hypothetical protein Q7R92_01665 [bacterium]|nr:hypothetical protein [bacterium]